MQFFAFATEFANKCKFNSYAPILIASKVGPKLNLNRRLRASILA